MQRRKCLALLAKVSEHTYYVLGTGVSRHSNPRTGLVLLVLLLQRSLLSSERRTYVPGVTHQSQDLHQSLCVFPYAALTL